MQERASSLCDAIKNKTNSSHAQYTRLVLYFDEVHVLTNDNLADDRTIYHALCREMSQWNRHPIFTVFLSTNSNLPKFAPPGYLHPSDRVNIRDSPQAPITELPFDCFPDEKPFKTNMTLSDVSEIEYMVKFGRPL